MVTARLLCGDVRAMLRTLPAESVQCVVTSPPYWGLRDYGTPGQLGLEPTPAEYVANMVDVFREVRRVLSPVGTLWLNLGDSYSAGGRGGRGGHGEKQQSNTGSLAVGPFSVKGVKPKQLLGIPWRVAFALQDDGWYLRSDIIWHKPNPMPESVRDRPTKAHEYIFLLTKQPRYCYDATAIAEKANYRVIAQGQLGAVGVSGRNDAPTNGVSHTVADDLATRNKRTVWTIATQPFNGARLMRGAGDGSGRKVSPDCPVHGDRPIQVSTSGYGGQPVVSQSDRNPDSNGRHAQSPQAAHGSTQMHLGGGFSLDSSDSPAPSCSPSAMPHSMESHRTGHVHETSQHETHAVGSARRTGRTEPQPGLPATSAHTHESRIAEDVGASDEDSGLSGQTASGTAHKCTCPDYTTITDHFAVFPEALVEPCILAGSRTGDTVLDPFCGSGTTGVVALRHGRSFVGIDLNAEYIAMTRRRIYGDAPLLNVVTIEEPLRGGDAGRAAAED